MMEQRPVLPEALAAQGLPGPHQPGTSRCHHRERPGPDTWRTVIKYSFEYLTNDQGRRTMESWLTVPLRTPCMRASPRSPGRWPAAVRELIRQGFGPGG